MRFRVKEIVDQPIEPWNRKQLISVIAIAAWIILVLFFKWDVGYTALMFAVILSLLNCGR